MDRKVYTLEEFINMHLSNYTDTVQTRIKEIFNKLSDLNFVVGYRNDAFTLIPASKEPEAKQEESNVNFVTFKIRNNYLGIIVLHSISERAYYYMTTEFNYVVG